MCTRTCHAHTPSRAQERCAYVIVQLAILCLVQYVHGVARCYASGVQAIWVARGDRLERGLGFVEFLIRHKPVHHVAAGVDGAVSGDRFILGWNVRMRMRIDSPARTFDLPTYEMDDMHRATVRLCIALQDVLRATRGHVGMLRVELERAHAVLVEQLVEFLVFLVKIHHVPSPGSQEAQMCFVRGSGSLSVMEFHNANVQALPSLAGRPKRVPWGPDAPPEYVHGYGYGYGVYTGLGPYSRSI